MKSHEIRNKFLKFFEERDHKIYPSSSLIPKDDPTLLFVNAGMNQFKDVILGKKKPEHRRAASCQKCFRVSGKHNDLEEVGKDTTHHTFFEMLGNWSFGDYFKKEAIIYAWEFLTEVCGLPKDRLWATVLLDDDEAEKLWYRHTDIKKGRVLRFDEKENFWEMGEVGPCGPCSEIHYDKGEKYKCDRPDCGVNCPCGRFMEIWNLVFMQYSKDENGNLSDLPAKGIDTGMSLERLTSVMQKVDSNYDTDLFRPLIRQTEKIISISYDDSDRQESFRVIADHIRALSFAITDGAIPSNEGQGYVVRRILRRAARHGRLLGLHKPFLYQLSSLVVDMMHDVYPELDARKQHVALVIKSEEERFEETLDSGLELFEKVTDRVKSEGGNTIPGRELFKLYDTYGFPVDLIEVMAQEKKLEVDIQGFESEMRQQQERSRSGAQSFGPLVTGMIDMEKLEGRKTQLIYGFEAEATVLQVASTYGEAIVLDKTPFYAEAGGQVSDVGVIESNDFEFEVTGVVREGDVIVHVGKFIRRPTELIDIVSKKAVARVDSQRCRSIMRNHTATHLLHKTLRETLGEHVNQSGSLVAPDRLRFDFTHFRALDQAELEKVEYLVNRKIWENRPVEWVEIPFEEAKKLGATALFGEKYGDVVRMVEVKGYSRELCGGKHVNATGEIGLFKILSETGVAAGIRRIEAVTGEGAYQFVRKQKELIDELAFILKTPQENLRDRVELLVKNNKQLEKKLKQAQKESAQGTVEQLMESCVNLDGIKVIAHQMDAESRDDLLHLADTIREKMKSTVGVLAAILDGKIAFVAVVTDDLIKSKGIKAGDVVKEISKLTGGTGGGKPHLAQGGGKDTDKLKSALDSLPEIVKRLAK
jgi:alanyl-tRNA synthetase